MSFDIGFGYTGSYAAGGHGPVADVPTTDNVVQDPDQEFDPDDGFSNAHAFDLAGAAHLRVAIPPEATEVNADLDLYLFDPDGNLAGSSTLGGTDEQIDVQRRRPTARGPCTSTAGRHREATPTTRCRRGPYRWRRVTSPSTAHPRR